MFKSIRISARAGKRPTTVVGAYAQEMKLPAKLPGVSAADRQALESALTAPGFKAEAGEIFMTNRGDLVVGLGKRDELTVDTLRTAGGRIIRRLDRIATDSVNLLVGEAIDRKAIDPWLAGRALSEGMGMANWRVDFFAGAATKNKPANPPITFAAASARFREGFDHGLTLADCVNEARRLAATPPNICNPSWLANEARQMARSLGMSCRVISDQQAQKLGMGGLCSVGQGSDVKPCLIILEYKPRRIAPRARNLRLALVGKSITYDTGGYSLKINNAMKGMKYDKCGGMAVLGAMRAIARLKLPVHVFGLLPAAENMVSDDSFRPDDIITMYNGVSVEVTNTDAEGRLVLGDALAYACKQLKPTAIVDLATLTGGIVTALGHFCAGVFCNDEKLLNRLNAAAESSSEKLWRMPLWKDHKDFMRAQHADILNSNASRNAHPIQGAAFLAYFVDEKIPWAHIDIAGVASVEKESDLFVQGPTGFGVRLLADFVDGCTR